MNEAHVVVTSVTCRLSDLIAFGKNSGTPETVFSDGEPVMVVVTVEFSGSGAIALMPLKPSIQVDFYAKCFGPGEELELGCVTVEAATKQLVYKPTLVLSRGLGTAGLVSDKIYKISALIRVGSPGYPSLVTGFIEGLVIQTYNL